jgi:fibronectin-binding autotransporter adhesin
MIITNPKIVRRFVVACAILMLVGVPAYATDLTWIGASNLIYDNANATGNWNPSVPTGLQANSENWIFPDATTLGAGSASPTFDSGGIFTLGGTSGGGLTIQAGAPIYTFTQNTTANGFDLAGSTYTSASTDRGVITNNSTNKIVFDMDVLSSRGTIDARSGDIYFNAGHTFTTGSTTAISGTANATSLTTIFQGDHNIYLNSTLVQNIGVGEPIGGNGVNQNMRGAIIYRGASTTADLAGALILGDLGATATNKFVIDSTNGGVVRATHNNSFGDAFYVSSGQRDTYIGNRSGNTGGTSNGVVELDGSAGNLSIAENFRGETRTQANGAPHIRNVAGNNTISGYVIAIINGGIASGADSFILESKAGTLKITGGIGFQIANQTATTYLQGDSNGEVGVLPATVEAPFPMGLSDNLTTSTMNVVKRGTGTWTNLAGAPNAYRGTTTISGGKYVMNGNHSFDVNPVGLTGAIGDYFVQTGGTLAGNGQIGSAASASPINVNIQDGILAPGDGVGTLTINGNLSFLDTSSLSYQLTNNVFTIGGGINDLTTVGGSLTLDGTLNVSVLSGTQLTAAGSYRLFDYTGTLTDNGLSLGSVALGAGLSAAIDTSVTGQINLVVSSGGLAGDYNGDGKVSAADYVVWRKGGSPDSTVAGYNLWRANFGNPPGSGSGLDSSSSVPEPTLCALVAIGTVLLGARRPARR